MKYIQCRLQKGESFQITWLPEKYAKVGNYVKILMGKDQWENGWQVLSCGVKLDEEMAIKQRDYYRTQREGSDV